jgi:hypothetical protein
VIASVRIQAENPYAMNPYEPTFLGTVSPPPISESDNIVDRLITASNVEDLVFYDVSDCNLYGRKRAQRLTGTLAERATAAGCDTLVYQSVLWWCFVFIPVFPRGVYTVIQKLECDDPDGDADQYRAIRVTWDWQQVGTQFLIVASVLALTISGGWFWISSR